MRCLFLALAALCCLSSCAVTPARRPPPFVTVTRHVRGWVQDCLLGIHLEQRRAHRTIRIVKARGIAHDLDEHELIISSTGVMVA